MSRVILMGLRGSGKTTLAPLLARRLKTDWADLDDMTKERMGARSVAEAWKAAGEPAFRAHELAALKEALGGGGPGVIALGGGTLMNEAAREWFLDFRRRGPAVVIYLRVTPDTQRRRLQDSALTDRPSLTGKGSLEELEDVFRLRDPVYRTIADHVIECDDLEPEPAVDMIVRVTGGKRA